jgi:MFS transporter, ACS family, tartrate transporter
MRQAFYRLLPILVLAYLTAFLDRVNIANAALTMNASIGLTAHMFGLGAGLFFISYFIFGPPSNLILERVGARYWIAPMVIGLGALSMGMALVKGPVTFLILRFLLGAAEAGFFPGVILYLTYWFPTAYRSRITAAFMMAIPGSLAIGGPISNAILHLSGVYGMEGWQWLFILEGAPTMVLGGIMYFLLPDRPESAKWLSADQKEWLTSTLKAEADRIQVTGGVGLRKAFSDPSVLLLSLIYLGNITTNLGIAYFLPLIIKSLGVTTKQTNYISAIPYLAGMVGIFIFGVLSDQYKEKRRLILALSLIIAVVGLAGAGFVNAISFGAALNSAYVSIGMVSLAAIGIYGAKAPFWPLPSLFLTGSAAAGGIAFINAIGNLGGFIGPYAVGWMKDTTHNYAFALYALAGFGLIAVLATLFLRIPGAGGSKAPVLKEVRTTKTPAQSPNLNRRNRLSLKAYIDIRKGVI